MQFITVESGVNSILSEFGTTVKNNVGYRTLIQLPEGKYGNKAANKAINSVINRLEAKGFHAWSSGGINYGSEVDANFHPLDGYTWE